LQRWRKPLAEDETPDKLRRGVALASGPGFGAPHPRDELLNESFAEDAPESGLGEQ
jgi:hypothetical protein